MDMACIEGAKIRCHGCGRDFLQQELVAGEEQPICNPCGSAWKARHYYCPVCPQNDHNALLYDTGHQAIILVEENAQLVEQVA